MKADCVTSRCWRQSLTANEVTVLINAGGGRFQLAGLRSAGDSRICDAVTECTRRHLRHDLDSILNSLLRVAAATTCFQWRGGTVESLNRRMSQLPTHLWPDGSEDQGKWWQACDCCRLMGRPSTGLAHVPEGDLIQTALACRTPQRYR